MINIFYQIDANMPMQYTVIFHGFKNGDFRWKIVIFFLFLLITLIEGSC